MKLRVCLKPQKKVDVFFYSEILYVVVIMLYHNIYAASPLALYSDPGSHVMPSRLIFMYQ